MRLSFFLKLISTNERRRKLHWHARRQCASFDLEYFVKEDALLFDSVALALAQIERRRLDSEYSKSDLLRPNQAPRLASIKDLRRDCSSAPDPLAPT